MKFEFKGKTYDINDEAVTIFKVEMEGEEISKENLLDSLQSDGLLLALDSEFEIQVAVKMSEEDIENILDDDEDVISYEVIATVMSNK